MQGNYWQHREHARFVSFFAALIAVEVDAGTNRNTKSDPILSFLKKKKMHQFATRAKRLRHGGISLCEKGAPANQQVQRPHVNLPIAD